MSNDRFSLPSSPAGDVLLADGSARRGFLRSLVQAPAANLPTIACAGAAEDPVFAAISRLSDVRSRVGSARAPFYQSDDESDACSTQPPTAALIGLGLDERDILGATKAEIGEATLTRMRASLALLKRAART